MENFVAGIQILVASMQANLQLTLGIIAGLLAINTINFLLGYRLNILGIHPRSIPGLIGIPFSPFLHAGFDHVFFNSIPLFVLSNAILLQGPHVFFCVSIMSIILTGLLLWLFGRRAIHVGASAVITSYMGYMLATAWYQNSAINIVLIIVILYYFGGILGGILPTREPVSWEGHLFGLLVGIFTYYACPIWLAA